MPSFFLHKTKELVFNCLFAFWKTLIIIIVWSFNEEKHAKTPQELYGNSQLSECDQMLEK